MHKMWIVQAHTETQGLKAAYVSGSHTDVPESAQHETAFMFCFFSFSGCVCVSWSLAVLAGYKTPPLLPDEKGQA